MKPNRLTLMTEIDPLLEGLNPQQSEAVTHAGGPLLVVAGAGSGKTRVLTRRIAYLMSRRNVAPYQILAITFTNKAAGEMKERVADLVGPIAKSMWVSTFHSACVRILRQEATRLGYSNSFSIYDSADSQRLITIVAKELNLDAKRYPARQFQSMISNAKNELLGPQDYLNAASNPFEQIVADVYAVYQQRLIRANAMDFDDLILKTVEVLQRYPEAKARFRSRFRHVLVDEYQDTNHAQYILVKELVGTELEGQSPAELCVVGDADQSIYGFRGATIRNILQFELDYPNARTVLLEQNYRSTQNILNAANAVITKNESRKEKNLWSDAGAGSPLTGYVAESEHDEANFIADEIRSLQREGVSTPGDTAIFYRTNAQSRVFEEVFMRNALPYKVVGGLRFYERREVKDLLAYLRVLANLEDEISLRRIINVPKPFGLEELVLRIRAILRRSKFSETTSNLLSCGPITLDESLHQVSFNGEVVDLSPTEFRLLHILLESKGRVLSKSHLLDEVWGINFETETTVVDTYISYLRKKLHRDGFEGIRTVRGVGFQMQAEKK